MADDVKDPDYTIRTQYMKDQSFENPNAPEIYGMMSQQQPNLDISIDVSPTQLQDRTYEVTLSLRADAKIGDQSAFVAELDYAGVVSFGEGVSDEDMQHLLMVETPHYLFPFARAIMASATRDGGFPPLVINPIDFSQLRNQQAKDGNGAGDEATQEAQA